MYTGLLHAHSSLRWIVLLLMLITGAKALAGWISKSNYNKVDDKLSLFTLIATHTQILLGFFLYFVSPNVWLDNFGEAMKTPLARYFTVEHAFVMLIVGVLITIGRSKSKKKENGEDKHKTVAIFYLLSLIFVLTAIYVMKP